ncbi:conserved domain protein [Prevotella denticola CRIS 18C-A]|uniref:Conserved domain protein n=1 Tax=Prevotella denticola CRIS 18C-A TaxID=944557 RepID=F0H7S0_9BACT|nr:conserved domain protein [Prevotella denticola CRIS 18C-A]
MLRRGCFHVCKCFCCSLSFFSVAILSRPANLRRIFGIDAGRGRKNHSSCLVGPVPVWTAPGQGCFLFPSAR